MNKLIVFALVDVVLGKWPLRGPSPHVDGVPASFDCSVRKLAYTYGKKLIPRMGAFDSLYYALDLNSADCHAALESNSDPESAAVEGVPTDAIFVAADGDDSAAGTFGAPMRSVQLAVDAAALAGKSTVVLRGGVHFLSETLFLDANLRLKIARSGLTEKTSRSHWSSPCSHFSPPHLHFK